jgi:hypothetical protein
LRFNFFWDTDQHGVVSDSLLIGILLICTPAEKVIKAYFQPKISNKIF